MGDLRPITLLVGENSTGKSTFLGCYRVLSELLFPWPRPTSQPDFNEEPFSMGSFRDIVRSRRGPRGRIDEFRLGIAVDSSRRSEPGFELWTTFTEKGSQPVVSSFRWDFGEPEFLEVRPNVSGQTTWKTPYHEIVTDFPFDFFRIGGNMFVRGGDEKGLDAVLDYVRKLFPQETDDPWSLSEQLSPPQSTLVPGAPLRSKPTRTYNPIREMASSDGEHVPMLMMRLNRTDKQHWNSLHDNLVDFGRESGMFSDVKVKGHGRQMSDPFQLQVKVRTGPNANIMDVGYGVSQSLPILVDIMAQDEMGHRSRRQNRTFLLQQPEVHLHPRGQAELASLFVQSVRKHRNRFLVETHSDYIVDRVRISVRKKELEPEDVSILYFDPQGNSVTIHNLSLDGDGNLRSVPRGYRDFFAKETDRLLGFAD